MAIIQKYDIQPGTALHPCTEFVSVLYGHVNVEVASSVHNETNNSSNHNTNIFT